MSQIEKFQTLIQEITDFIGDKPLDRSLQAQLNERFPCKGEVYERIFDTCRTGISEGWMCQYEGGGVRYGRVIKPTPAINGYSVDVVDMQDIAGPHHRHPNGEIDLIMPLDETAEFDGNPAG